MKRYLLLLFISVTTSAVFAQTDFRFTDSTAQWNVLEAWQGWCWCYTWQTHLLNVSGDTLIGGQPYQVIQYGSSPIAPLEATGKFYVRRDSLEKVYGKVNPDSTEYLLYDFSRLPGDTFFIGIHNQWPSTIKITIDSVTTVFWNKSRKVQYVTTDAIGMFNDIFVEGIGSLRSFFLYPGVEYSFVDGPDYGLLCYFENDTNVYHNAAINTCVLDSSWVGIKELQKNEVGVTPNPATDFIVIQSATDFPSPTTFQLFDITGRLVLQKLMTGARNRIELNKINKGMYLYDITLLNTKMNSGKLIVQ